MYTSVFPAFKDNNLTIVLESSDYFAPYASVTMLSIIEHTAQEYNYDFLVMTWDMQEETVQKLKSLADGRKNVSIRILDVSKEAEIYQEIGKKGKSFLRFEYTGIIRLIIPQLLNNYEKILHLDCDLIVCADVAKVFQIPMDDSYISAAPDAITYARYYTPGEKELTDNFLFKRLKLTRVDDYLNSGVMLLNLKKIRRDFTQKQVMDFIVSEDGSALTYYEQDTFNGLFVGNKNKLPFEWNWQVDARGLISRGKPNCPADEPYLKQYYQAESDKKVIHFMTGRKPWEDAAVPYAEKWWEYARRSPLFDRIMKNVKGYNNAAEETDKRILLFVCDSFYHVINACNIKRHYYPNVPADVVLASSTSVGSYGDQLEKAEIFRKIIRSEYDFHTDDILIMNMPIEKRTLYPDRFEHMPKFEEEYSDLFIPCTKHHFYQMIYYSLGSKGAPPTVHIYDEGDSTYVDNLRAEEYKVIDHGKYPVDKRFYTNIADMFLYRPDLYCGSSKIRTIPIPKLDTVDTEFIQMLCSIFGEVKIPNEKYIFLNEPFLDDIRISNEIQILDVIADIVGKDNMVIKMHPRSTKLEEIYKMHGYHLFSSEEFPWEMTPFLAKIDDKVLMSISSDMIWTPVLISGASCQAISLLNVMKLSKRPHTNTREYRMLLQKIKQQFEKSNAFLYIPNTCLELRNVIRFIEGEA